MSIAIKVEGVSKRYRLGDTDRRMFYQEVQSTIARWRGIPDPNSRIGSGNDYKSAGRDYLALSDVSFTIDEGEAVGIIGRNGAGKSTILKILSQITLPSSGRVLVKGRVASMLEVGTGFHPELTGRENVYLNGAILGMRYRRINAMFDDIAQFSGVEEFLDTPVKRYSSGMRVRLAFAVAAHLDPEILIIDEVLAVGDAAFQQKCLSKLGEVSRQGRTVILVSHQLAAVESFCRRGILLHGGRVAFDGSQSEAIDRYLDLDGARPVALAERKDRRGSGQVRFTRVEFRDPSGRTVTTLSSGHDVDVVLHYACDSSGPMRDVGVYLSVRSHLDVVVFHQANHLRGRSFGCLPQQGAFVCRLRDLPLPPGHYRLSMGMRSHPRDGDIIDHIDDAVTFAVEGGDFFGTGLGAPPNLGACLVRGDWRLIEGDG